MLITTITARPYVFAFFIAFLILAWRRWGWRKTILWLASGYLIAWLSEYSSIHNGFPYGHYRYVYENMPGDLMVAGVPFFDSLSYPFLAFAAFATGSFLMSPKRLADQWRGRKAITLVLLGAFLTMILDVIVDPVATMGEEWFLGKIHYYLSPGWYFGVPLTNFGGWFLVAFAIIGFNVVTWHAFPTWFKQKHAQIKWPTLEPMFYLSIGLFQTFIAFWIGAIRLGMANVMILSAVTIAILIRKEPS